MVTNVVDVTVNGDVPVITDEVIVLNEGVAEVLTSCGVFIVSVLPDPETVTPLPLLKFTTPVEGTAVPVVPTNEFDEVFALAYTFVAKV